MATIYEYKGVSYELPDGLTEDAALSRIKSSLQPTPTQPEAKAPSSGFMMGLKDPITAGAQIIPRALGAVASLGGTKPNSLSDLL